MLKWRNFGAFGEKIIELMKENAGGLNIVPDSLGKPIEPKPETLIKRKERIFELPFSPGIQQIGRGWDSRFDRLAKRLVTFSKYDSAPTADNPEYITPAKIQYAIRDRLGAADSVIEIYRSGRDYATDKCKYASYFGLAPCILDPKVSDAERIVQGHTIFAEESKTFESHTVSLQGTFASADKIVRSLRRNMDATF